MERKSKATKPAAKRATKKQMTLMNAVETIVDKAYASQLSDKFMQQCKDEIQFLADSYGITPMQAILFCITLECGPRNVSHYELPQYLDLRRVKALSFGADINALVKMRLMRFRDKDKDSFCVPEHIINALRENVALVKPSFEVKDCDMLLERIGDWFEALSFERLSLEDFQYDLYYLLKDNTGIGFARQMLDLKLSDNNMTLLAFFCSQLVNEDDIKIAPRQFRDLFSSNVAFKRTVNLMAGGSHPLMKLGLIEHVCEDGIANTSLYTLTDKARNGVLAEFSLKETEVKLSDVLKPDSITAKAMFYPKSMTQQIDELGTFLDREKFSQIQERMTENGFRTGFTCLFYGSPGTGKTETAYQLARNTGRSIMLVDIPQIKSKWVGDSEKNIKALFDRYREMVKRSDVAPILLFNEADAIFGVRKQGAENAVDKMENSLQNIILQEMENLQGILIATTNLATNLDSAFDRRFLYKVKFEKPDVSVRSSLWQEMLPGLSKEDADALAKAYELSGGQIENVARKDAANRILYGDINPADRLAALMDYCKAEGVQSIDTPKRIGF